MKVKCKVAEGKAKVTLRIQNQAKKGNGKENIKVETKQSEDQAQAR